MPDPIKPSIFQKYIDNQLRSNPNYNINSDRLLNVKDNRKINATTGKKINPNKDLMSGKYSEQLISDITKEAIKQGIDPHTAIAISLQETNLGRRDDNVGHVLSKYGTGDPIYDMVSSLKQSQEKAKSLGLKNENDVLQTYNGRGKIFPNTEQGYHGFKMKQIYGVDLPAEGIDMRKNPLYGKRVIDLRENIVKQNPAINTIVNNKGLSVDPFTTPLNTYAEGGFIDPPTKKTADQLNKEAYERSLLQAKKELAKEYVEKNMKDVTDSTLWNLPGNVYIGIPKYGINLGKGAFNSVKHQAKMLGLAQADNLITEGANQIKEKYAMGGNMSTNKYANGGQLTHFNEGGSHESNPNGGIPLGNNASVEQGETKKGNYVYSDRLYINEDLVKQFNLPNSIKGKTFANASKVIEKPFKDKNSNPDRATQKEHLDRLKEAQETLKEQEAKMQQSMQANSQEIPDQMNGEIPEGMEQFMGQEQEQPQQFAGGGYYDTNNPYGFTNPGQQPIQGPYNQVPIGIGSPAGLMQTPGATMSAPTNMGLSAGQTPAKSGGLGMAGNAMGALGIASSLQSGDTAGAVMGGAQMAASNGLLGAGAQGAMGAAGTGLGVLGAAQGAMALGALSQGQGASRGNGASAATGAMTGAMAGSAFGPVGAGVGAVVGAGAGLMGANKARKESAELGRLNAKNANAVYKDTEVVAAYGGPIPINKPTKGIVNDVYNQFNALPTLKPAGVTSSPIYNRRAGIDEATPNLTPAAKFTGPSADPSLNNFTNNFGEPNRFDRTGDPNRYEGYRSYGKLGQSENLYEQPQGSSFLQKAGNYLKDNKGELMRLAPVGMNALQLANLKRPGQVSLNRLSNVYKPSYIDEAGIQNRLDSENQNTINALTNSSGGSEASLRAGILASQAGRLRARGDAYAGMQQYNNSQDAAAQNFKLGIDQANIGQANLQQDINDKNMGNYDTQKSKLLGQIGTDIGSIGKEKVFGKKAGQIFGYDENGKYIITPEGTKTYVAKEESTTLTPEQKAYLATMPKAYGGYLRKNKKGY